MKVLVILSLLLVMGIGGCATPVVSLKDDATGQIAQCGGDASGSAMFGLAGYAIQKNNDETCVKDYESKGFTKIQ